MGSKAFLLLGLLLAIVLLISSEVAARDLAETSSDQKNVEAAKEANGVDVAKYGGYGGYPGGGYGGYPEGRHRVMTAAGPRSTGSGVTGPPRCTKCCSYA